MSNGSSMQIVKTLLKLRNGILLFYRVGFFLLALPVLFVLFFIATYSIVTPVDYVTDYITGIKTSENIRELEITLKNDSIRIFKLNFEFGKFKTNLLDELIVGNQITLLVSSNKIYGIKKGNIDVLSTTHKRFEYSIFALVILIFMILFSLKLRYDWKKLKEIKLSNLKP